MVRNSAASFQLKRVRALQTKTSKVQILKYKHTRGRNNPLEWSSRSSQPADRTGLSKQLYQPIERAVRSNLPFDRPAHSTHPYLFTFPRYLSLCYRTIQANLTLSAPFNPQSITVSILDPFFFAFSTFGCYIRYLSNHNQTQTI
ncbi:hypothetical protein HanPI659440_Chr14g0571211 [Helianthus annuus]|nr:hypothetical protein HanPI659440_Chr14g0571211 [Helianthus annuus]